MNFALTCFITSIIVLAEGFFYTMWSRKCYEKVSLVVFGLGIIYAIYYILVLMI